MGRSESRVDFGGWNKSKVRSCFRLCTAGCPTCALRNPQLDNLRYCWRGCERARHAADLCIICAERRPQPHIPGSVGRSPVTSPREHSL